MEVLYMERRPLLYFLGRDLRVNSQRRLFAFLYGCLLRVVLLRVVRLLVVGLVRNVRLLTNLLYLLTDLLILRYEWNVRVNVRQVSDGSTSTTV